MENKRARAHDIAEEGLDKIVEGDTEKLALPEYAKQLGLELDRVAGTGPSERPASVRGSSTPRGTRSSRAPWSRGRTSSFWPTTAARR